MLKTAQNEPIYTAPGLGQLKSCGSSPLHETGTSLIVPALVLQVQFVRVGLRSRTGYGGKSAPLYLLGLGRKTESSNRCSREICLWVSQDAFAVPSTCNHVPFA